MPPLPLPEHQHIQGGIGHGTFGVMASYRDSVNRGQLHMPLVNRVPVANLTLHWQHPVGPGTHQLQAKP
jgi:hypothetical protein